MAIDTITPTKLELIKFTNVSKTSFGEVKTGQIFDNTSAFHSEGLFSTEIFGRVGTEERSETLAIIKLNVFILQPILYKNLLDLGSKYARIMEGKEYAIFDPKEKDLVISNSNKAQTGFDFFMKNLPNIEFKKTSSTRRDYKIKLIKDSIAEGKAFTDVLLVLPAGMRDYIVTPSGKPEEDEINGLYRKVLSRASLIDPYRSAKNPSLYDETALGIQKAVYEIYQYVISLLEGKHKLIQSKWTSRKIFNTTSNVISSYVDKTKGNNDPRKMKYNDTRCGLFQYCRAAAPLTLHHIRNKYIREILPDYSNIAYLTNVKTMKKEEVVIRGIQKDVDLWTTIEGLEKVIASLNNPIVSDDLIYFGRDKKYCIGLVYRDDVSFRFLQDIDDLPEGLDRSRVKPVTLYEFIYMSIYEMSGKYPGLITRYPITGYGSIYPSWVTIVTTIDTESLVEREWDWNIPKDNPDKMAAFFPVRGSGYTNTLVVSQNKLALLGGDSHNRQGPLKLL